VVVAPVRAVQEAPLAEYTGLIQPVNKVLLSSDVAGRVARLVKKAGDRVEKNQLLVELENPTLDQDLAVLQAKVKETEAQLELQVQQQQRVETLYRKKLTSEQQFQDGKATLGVVQAKLNADKVQVERLQDQLARMVIRSPIVGQLISAHVETGQWITPNQPIFEIYNYDRFEVFIGVPGRFLTSVRNSGRVEVTVPELGITLEGEIQVVVHNVDPATGNFSIRIGIENPRQLPLSGMLTKVKVPLGERDRLLTVPRDAVVRRIDSIHVVVVDNGRAKVIPVRILGNREDSVIVAGKGLRSDMQVVVRGNERLFPGMPVEITNAKDESKTGKS
jgi:RND family efflux transporter MFP subunit